MGRFSTLQLKREDSFLEDQGTLQPEWPTTSRGTVLELENKGYGNHSIGFIVTVLVRFFEKVIQKKTFKMSKSTT